MLTPKTAPLVCSGQDVKSPLCCFFRGRFFSRHSPCVQAVEHSWDGRTQKSWLVSQGEGLTPKTQSEFMCADDQLWKVGPNGTQQCGKVPQITFPSQYLVRKGLVCAPPNKGPGLGERGEGSEWEREFGC